MMRIGGGVQQQTQQQQQFININATVAAAITTAATTTTTTHPIFDSTKLPTLSTLPIHALLFPSFFTTFSSTQRILPKSYATRRRRVNYTETKTYVYMEPGKSEQFISEEELMANLTAWLQNWPNDQLPPDLAKFQTLDDAVTYLVKFVCELEIDGDVGSLQWYQVCLE